ncbi:DUF1540 domain-containing protein [Oscillospiraceae bacterium CM]|nr:DUF1540 domain-containing protein [Oscillospiraceae bacterium CM]
MTDSKHSDVLYGVGCDAVNCKFHGHDNRCFADSIMVESPDAHKKAETFCSTFAPRATGVQ